MDSYRRACEHSDATIAALDIDAPGHVPWWPRPDVKLFNVMVHLLAETHRHAGHTDILREQLDGAVGTEEEHTVLDAFDAEFWALAGPDRAGRRGCRSRAGLGRLREAFEVLEGGEEVGADGGERVGDARVVEVGCGVAAGLRRQASVQAVISGSADRAARPCIPALANRRMSATSPEKITGGQSWFFVSSSSFIASTAPMVAAPTGRTRG